MKTINRLFAGVGAIVLCGIVVAFVQEPLDPTPYPTVVYRSYSRQYVCDDDPTFAQLEAICDATALDAQLPEGVTFTKSDGRVVAAITDSLVGPPAEYAISVTVYGDSADVDTAALYLDGAVIFNASRASGSIVDRNGKALATLTGLIPQTGSFAVEVTWTSTSGQVREERLSF